MIAVSHAPQSSTPIFIRGGNTAARVRGVSYRTQKNSEDYIQSFYSNLHEFKYEISKGTELTNCESFRKLVDNADATLDLIMHELRPEEPSPLVWVLEEANRENPSSSRDNVDISESHRDWMAWYEFRQSSGMKLTKMPEEYPSTTFGYRNFERNRVVHDRKMYRIVEVLPFFLCTMVAIFFAYTIWGLYASLYGAVAVGMYGLVGFGLSAFASIWLKKEVEKTAET